MELKTLIDDLNKALKFFESDIASIRATGAHPSLLSKVMVSSYGAMVPLNNVATVVAQDGTTLIVSPFDKTMVKEILQSISKANIGLNGIEFGEKIRVPVPSLTTEKREMFSKEAKEKAEKAKVSVRNIRQAFLHKAKEDKTIREGDLKRIQDNVQKEVDKTNKEIENILKHKIDSLMKI